jgi:hypothetical protein
MAAPQVFTPENRLSKVIGGLGASESRVLVSGAEDRVNLASEAVRTFVRDEVRVILSFSGKSEENLHAESHRLEDSAVRVAEVAGAVGLEAIGEVARGMVAMMASLRTTGVLHIKALELHLSSLALINQGPGGQTADVEVILTRLATMRHAIGIAE